MSLETAGTIIFGVLAVCTFLMKGKQWPTFITAGIFGAFLGQVVTGPVKDALDQAADAVSKFTA